MLCVRRRGPRGGECESIRYDTIVGGDENYTTDIIEEMCQGIAGIAAAYENRQVPIDVAPADPKMMATLAEVETAKGG